MSDVFDAYAKLAIERGLIKVADKSKELKKYEDDEAPRAGSDSIDVIESLYKIKHKDYKYDRNIMELAHPNKVIIAPAYDRINTLLENNIERQRILLNIVTKPSHGHLTNHRYATSDLMMSLTKIANELDNKNEDGLRVLADTCLSQLHSKALSFQDVTNWISGVGSDAYDIGGGALAGGTIGAVVGGLIGAFGGPVGILLGAEVGAASGAFISALFKTGPQAKNVSINSQIAYKKVSLLGRQSDPFIAKLEEMLLSTSQIADKYAELISKMNMPDASEADGKDARDLGLIYQNKIVQLNQVIEVFLTNMKSGLYEPKDSGDGVWDKIKAPWEALVGTKLTDAANALQTLESLSKKALEGIVETRSHAKSLKEDQETKTIKMPNKPKKAIDDDMVSQLGQIMKEFSK